MAVPVGMPDHALLTRARDGDGEAFEALYRRHHRAATRAAHSYSSRTQLAEDAVQEAFLRILHATREGGGPTTEFRAYLATTVRHVIAGWVRGERSVVTDDLEALAGEDVREGSKPESRLRWHLLTKAFKSLPTRWQEALWLGEVEGIAPAELGERWNMSANSAAALCYRARDGLRTAWLDAHVNEGLVPDGCRPYVTDLSRYTQGKLTDRREKQVRAHLDDCDYCRGVLFEVDTAATELRVLLIPVALWGGLALAGAGLTLGPLQMLGKTLSGIGKRGLALGAASTATVVVVVIAAMNPGVANPGGGAGDDGRSLVTIADSSGGVDAGAGGSGSEDDDAAEPAADDTADDPGSATTIPTDETSTAPPATTDDDDPAPEPTSSTPVAPPSSPVPAVPAPTDPAVTDPTDDPTEDPTETTPETPAAPDAPAIGHRVTNGAIELYGAGEPGATISIDVADTGTATATSGTGATSRSVAPRAPLALPGTEVATTTVDSEGNWSVTPALDEVAGLTVVATQTLDGVESAASGPVPLPSRPSAPAIDGFSSSGTSVEITGTGAAAHATVRVLDADSLVLAAVEADGNGAWVATFALDDEHANTDVVAVQVAANGLASLSSEPFPLPDYVPPTDPVDPEEPEEPAPLAPLTLEVDVADGMLVFTGAGEPGATVTVGNETITLGSVTIPEEGTWNLDAEALPELSGVEVIATQVLGQQTSQTEPLTIPLIEDPPAPEQPDAPTVWVGLLLGDTVRLLGAGTPGASVIVLDSDGEPVGETYVSDLSEWTIEFTDPRISGDGLTITAVQVVDGVASPGSPPLRLQSLILMRSPH